MAAKLGSVTLREKHRLMVFVNRVLRRPFGEKGREVTGYWRKLHNKKLHSSYSLLSIIRMIKPRQMRSAERIAQMREKNNACRLLVEKPEGKSPLGRPRWGV
jgi:hypothetical protein